MNNKKSKPLGGGVYNQYNLQLFADLAYTKVDNPYEIALEKNTYAKGYNEEIYNLVNYASREISDYTTITDLSGKNNNMNYIAKALPKVTSIRGMFANCSKLTSLSPLVDVTGYEINTPASGVSLSISSIRNITDMSYMFSNCDSICIGSNISDPTIYEGAVIVRFISTITKYNKIINMESMFENCTRFIIGKNSGLITIGGISKVNLTSFVVDNVTDMSNMFKNCFTIFSIGVGGVPLDQVLDISGWNTSNVKNFSNMFYGDKYLTTITGVIDMQSCTSYDNMFYNCSKLRGVQIQNPPPGVTATSGIGGLAAGKYEIV